MCTYLLPGGLLRAKKNDNFFRQYDALTYHKPKCKQAKEDARLKAEKAEKSKVEGQSKNEIKTEDTDSDAAREVAHTLLEMKNEPNHDGGSGQSPIPQAGPPQLAKRPAQGPSQVAPKPASMPRLVPKPNVPSDSMPPLPKLQPRPGLPVLQPKPNAGSAPNTPQGTPIKAGQPPRSPQLSSETEGKLVMAETAPTGSPQVGVKRPHSPFKPVQPAGIETPAQPSPSHATQNNAR